MNAQEHFLHRFEPVEHGLIYRATPGAPGVSVTVEERAEMVALDDDRGGIATILYVVTLPLAAAVGVGLSMNPVTSPWAKAGSASISFGLPISALVWVSTAPNRILRGRPLVDKGPSNAEVARRRSARETCDLSWALTAIVSIFGGLKLASSIDQHIVLRLLGVLWALLSIGMFVDGIRIERRIRAQDRRARVEET